MPAMKVTVCELPNGWAESESTWIELAETIQDEQSDLVLLPEMPFYRWLAGTTQATPDLWLAAVAAHDDWMARLSELSAPIVVGTRPIIDGDCRHNQGFVWEKTPAYRDAHIKYYLPDEEGFWEATWYQRGDGRFDVIDVAGVKIGFLICTELWFNAHARAYATQGIHILVCPRATPHTSIDTWITGGRTAAVVSGAFCLSSNFNGPHIGGMAFGGTGWIIEPEAGGIMGLTSEESPILTIDIDLSAAEKAKQTYPRYVAD
jgi:N-carbamoylputrescine amidase